MIRRGHLSPHLLDIFPVALLAIGMSAIAIHAYATRSTTPLFGQAFVIDGDTIVVQGTHIRLSAIDAPESDQTCNDAQGISYPCGAVATAYLKFLIDAKPVHCIQKDTDRYGRIVARCFVDGADLGEAMVRSGHAIDYRRYDREGLYAQAQAEAKHLQLGVWRGVFVPPEVWRRQK